MAVKIWKMSSKHSNDKALGNKMHKKHSQIFEKEISTGKLQNLTVNAN